MGIISTIKRWFTMNFTGTAENVFEVKNTTTNEEQTLIKRCADVYRGFPYWANDDVKTINMAQAICEETARLAVLATKITVDGKGRGEWLQSQIDELYYDIRPWVEYACAYGTVILKPNGESVNVYLPTDFIVTNQRGRKITGAVFYNRSKSNDGKTHYTRLEYHRFLDNGMYCVTNRCYVGTNENDTSKPINIKVTPWKGLQEEVFIQNLDKPLFSVLKMPNANTVNIDSPLSMPIFASALEELKDLDVAYSRNADEVFDSQRTVLLDSDRLLPTKNSTNASVQAHTRQEMQLPRYVRNVMGSGEGDIYHEINPSLNTQTRIDGINALLSQIGYKCGFSNGYFVFNQKGGLVTATQVESDDRRTLQTIKDIRDCIENALTDLVYALDKFADLYDLSQTGTYEITFDFGDLTYNREEDRARWIQYANMGIVPKWKILEKFEGMSEEEAKASVAETEQHNAEVNRLFAD